MPEKRKDRNGKVLRAGESQRKDLLYQYRYTDLRGKRQTVYASDLHELRRKEDEIQKGLTSLANYKDGQIRVIDLAAKYIGLKRGVRKNTEAAYEQIQKFIKQTDLGYMRVGDVRSSDAREMCVKLKENGMSYSTISAILGVLRPAFAMAVDDDIIAKTPFNFALSDVVKKEEKERIALTQEQQDSWMAFVRSDWRYRGHYDDYVVLFGTGIRVSEYCGLTLGDLDFENRKITVERQLIKTEHGEFYINPTKTKNGSRCIPMTDDVYQSLQNIVARRPILDVEPEVDGVSGFLTLNQHQNPIEAQNVRNWVTHATKMYNKKHPDDEPIILTPHVMRHTFCTRMANSGISPKALQYLMGHSDISVTLDVYTHSEYDMVADQMLGAYKASKKIVSFSTISGLDKTRKSG